MHYLKDIFNKVDSEHAHNKFIRYSKGKFIGPKIKIKVTKNGIKLNGSFHLVDELLMLMAEYLKNREVLVKGTLSWNKDLSPELEQTGIKYLKVTKSRGIFNYTLENTIKFKEFVDTLGDYHILISFKEEDITLSTKPKFPKPNKDITNDFCKTNFPQSMAKKILSEFAFDVKQDNIKEILITNDIIVEDIKLPDIDNFEEARKLAKRAGTIKREVIVNGGEPVVSEVKFNI